MEFGSQEKINGHTDKYTEGWLLNTHTHIHTLLVKSNKQKRTGHIIRNNIYLRYKGKKCI